MILKINTAHLFLFVALFACGSASAHDLWILTDPPNPKIGQVVTVRVVLGHNFPEGSETPQSDMLKVMLVDPSGERRVLTTTQKGIYQQAEFVRKHQGTYTVTAELQKYFAEINGKMYYEPKDKLSVKPQFSSYAQQSARTEIKSLAASSQPAGLPLEIVPQIDPATVHVGGLLPVRVYAGGKPVVPLKEEEIEIRAVYAGFQVEEDTFAFSGHVDQEGNCRIKITQAGQWMALVVRNLPPTNPIKSDHDHYDSTLTFEIPK